MTNLQLLLSIGVPTFAIVVATVFSTSYNNARFGSLESAMTARFAAIEQRLIVIEGDLRRFYEMLGRHEGEIQTLKDRIK